MIIAVHPQRHNGKAWCNCLPHQAQRWAVMLNGGVLCSRPNKRLAEAAMASAFIRETAKRKRTECTLGARCKPAKRPVIARSMTTDEYNSK